LFIFVLKNCIKELSDDDFDRRIEFCDLMDRIIRDSQFQNNIALSDKATFTMIGEIN